MSHTSPATYLVWTLLTGILGVFLLFHLWSFDRFKCIKWDSGAHSGAFKRIMTYSYLLSIPLIFAYALGMTIIKYRQGFIALPLIGTIVPKPYQLWGKVEQAAIFPFTLMFSIGWSMEIVTHLEELCFWLFLVNSGSAQQNWFRSPYFKVWVGGSMVAVIYMPLVTIFTRSNHLMNEAYTFLAGSLGSLCLTLWFMPVLWTFPRFLNNLRADGVDTSTIVRLTKFSELNNIRVLFRFLFTLPLLVLGVDGVTPHKHVNESMFWTDILAIIAGFGCAISSGITLVIFFPRSIEGEIAAKDAAKERQRQRSQGRTTSFADSNVHIRSITSMSHPIQDSMSGTTNTYLLNQTPMHKNIYDLHTMDIRGDTATVSVGGGSPTTVYKSPSWTVDDDEERDTVPSTLPPIRPNRRRGKDIEVGGIDLPGPGRLTEGNLEMHDMGGLGVNPMIQNFTSPIDLAYGNPENESRLTFRR
ncbi:hypothetical protein BDQ17DRAFT_1297791 [Cyathus striatus]|nr:hypothetical protein BDQ17DRAFT_1297791 [Cyathus striatus]